MRSPRPVTVEDILGSIFGAFPMFCSPTKCGERIIKVQLKNDKNSLPINFATRFREPLLLLSM